MIGGAARTIAVALFACTLVSGVVAVGTVGTVAAGGIQEAEEGPPGERLEGFDEVVTVFEIQENGSATLTVDYRFVRETANGTDEEWAALREDIEADPEPYVEAERARWEGAAADARNRTEREMAIGNVSVRTDERSTPREYGHVEFTVEWDGFAHVELNRIEAGDAIDGYVLDDGTSLQFAWPAAYENISIEPNPDKTGESVVGWNGQETDFVDGEPRVELLRTNGGSIGEPTDGGASFSVPPTAWLLGLVALVVAVGTIGWYAGRGSAGGPAGRTDVTDDGGSRDAPDSVQADRSGPDRDEGPPPELLSNEERVLRLLADRGGRVKQQEVVSTLDWTEAKTSQVVGALREDGEIDAFRVGRENVLVLPSADDTAGVAGGGGSNADAAAGGGDASAEAAADEPNGPPEGATDGPGG